MKKRFSDRGVYRVLCAVAALAAVVCLNVLAQSLQRRFHLQADLSYNALTTLSDSTLSILHDLQEDITLYVARVDGIADTQVESVAEQYAFESSRIHVSYIEPDQEPVLMGNANPEGVSISAGTVVVAGQDGSSLRLLPVEDFTLYGTTSYNGKEYTYKAGYQYEKLLDQAILGVTRERVARACFVQGHGEFSAGECAVFMQLLEDNGWQTETLQGALALPEAGSSVVILCSPTKDITQEESEALREYLRQGGSLMITRDPGTVLNTPCLDAFLSYYGISYANQLVIANPGDASAYYPGNPTLMVSEHGDHEALGSLSSQEDAVIISPQCVPVQPAGMARNELQTGTLLSSREDAYAVNLNDSGRATIEQRADDPVGRFSTAVAVSRVWDWENRSADSRLVALGSTSIVNNSAFNQSFYNAEFALNVMNWLLKDENASLDIVFKAAVRDALKLPSQQTLYMLAAVLAAIPLVILAAGAVVKRRRNRL